MSLGNFVPSNDIQLKYFSEQNVLIQSPGLYRFISDAMKAKLR